VPRDAPGKRDGPRCPERAFSGGNASAVLTSWPFGHHGFRYLSVGAPTQVSRDLELQTYDLRMRILSSPSPATRSVIVAIDDASMARLGRWPWPRSHHAEVIQKLKTAGAKVIAPAIQFQEPDEGSGLQVLDRLDRYVDASLGDRPKELLDPLRQELARVRGELDHDARLEKAIGEAGNVVLLMPMQGASADRRQTQPAASPVSVSQQAFHVVKKLGKGLPSAPPRVTLPWSGSPNAPRGWVPSSFPWIRMGHAGRKPGGGLSGRRVSGLQSRGRCAIAGVTSEQMACQLGQGVTLGSRLVETDPGMRMFIQYLGDERTVRTSLTPMSSTARRPRPRSVERPSSSGSRPRD